LRIDIFLLAFNILYFKLRDIVNEITQAFELYKIEFIIDI